jgi:hypothetical protein
MKSRVSLRQRDLANNVPATVQLGALRSTFRCLNSIVPHPQSTEGMGVTVTARDNTVQSATYFGQLGYRSRVRSLFFCATDPFSEKKVFKCTEIVRFIKRLFESLQYRGRN